MAVSNKQGSNQQAVIAGVTDLLPALRQRAQEAEDSRMVPAESVKALAETGFFRLLQPESAGGLEADPVTFFTAVGLRGTGSNDIVVDSVFVPRHHALSFTEVSKCRCPGHEVNSGPLYRIPFGSIFSYAITTPIIGMATGAYQAHVEYQQQRVRASYAGQRSAEDPFAQVRIAEAAALIDAAWLALERDMTERRGHATSTARLAL